MRGAAELVGTALSFQMATGYVVTVAGIIALPAIQEVLGWRHAFATLAPGAAVAFAAMLWLLRIERRQARECEETELAALASTPTTGGD